MTGDFDGAFATVVGLEGVYSTNPDDAGNWTGGWPGHGILRGTKYGISAAAYPNLDIENLTLDAAKTIYRADYWQIIAADLMPSGVALMMFDFAVNQGAGVAADTLQAAVRVTRDGEIGSITLGAVRAFAFRPVAEIAARRGVRYAQGNMAVFGLGWMRRLFLITRLAETLVVPPQRGALHEHRNGYRPGGQRARSRRQRGLHLWGVASERGERGQCGAHRAAILGRGHCVGDGALAAAGAADRNAQRQRPDVDPDAVPAAVGRVGLGDLGGGNDGADVACRSGRGEVRGGRTSGDDRGRSLLHPATRANAGSGLMPLRLGRLPLERGASGGDPRPRLARLCRDPAAASGRPLGHRVHAGTLPKRSAARLHRGFARQCAAWCGGAEWFHGGHRTAESRWVLRTVHRGSRHRRRAGGDRWRGDGGCLGKAGPGRI